MSYMNAYDSVSMSVGLLVSFELLYMSQLSPSTVPSRRLLLNILMIAILSPSVNKRPEQRDRAELLSKSRGKSGDDSGRSLDSDVLSSRTRAPPSPIGSSSRMQGSS